MRRIISRRAFAAFAFVSIVFGGGCQSFTGPSTTSVGIPPNELIDPQGYGDIPLLPIGRDLFQVSERIRLAQKPAELPAKKTCLALSGGGSYGAFQAGLLVGWSEAGNRPEFDAVTGVSTGALVATLAFLGPGYDSELQRVYTSLNTEDIYLRRWVKAFFSDSLADNSPLASQIDKALSPEVMTKLAAEHRKGRRLYISTTDLESRQPVVWDVGAIAARAEPGAKELIAKLLLASAAIPVFFPPVEIPVEVDGRRLVERHVDGGVTQNVFFRPPQVPPELRLRPPADFLYGSDLYVVIAGKLFADPEVVKPRMLDIASGSVSTLIYAQTRSELGRMYHAAMLAGMNYHLAAIPQNFPAPGDSKKFDPVEMTRMFEEGRRQALAGTAWRTSPPGSTEGENVAQRAGNRLSRVAPNKPNDSTPVEYPLRGGNP